MEIRGRVEEGLKEAAHFVERYNPHFLRELGFSAFLGTLNVRAEVDLPKGKTIDPGNGFFKVRYLKAKIHGLDAAIVIPEKSKHDSNIIEIIAAVNLRETLNLKDGDEICIKLA